MPALSGGAAPLADVLAVIANAVLGDERENTELAGTVALHDHQRDALRRVRASIRETGGALLADEPGLGKTYVALALAREYPAAIVVAPAALRAMWRSAGALAGVDATFVSMEALSRRGARTEAFAARRDALVIVDEAHHAANRAAARYARLARLVAYRPVLLLSATPVRNRRAEEAALLALFLGPRAGGLDDAARARCIVRRAGDASLRPAIDGPHWHRVRAHAGVGEAIATLAPPLPALDGTEAAALLRISLARCWASSLAALDAALRRRLQRGAALAAVLDEGRLPTRAELRAWVAGDDAVQLAFPMFASREVEDAARLRAVLRSHMDGVQALRARIKDAVTRDSDRRARVLRDLRRMYPGASIVAFTAHASTAEALFRAMRRDAGVALLTARGARSAGGARPRSDVVDALAGPAASGGGVARRPAHSRDQISLVIATDLLSEGVNLQGASVVVHLDVPWTPAGLDQRVGRAARIGSAHARVHVHGLAAPAAAQALLALDRRIARKRIEQRAAARAPDEAERLRSIVRQWITGSRRELDARERLVASARGSHDGFLAVVDGIANGVAVCAGRRAGRRWSMSDAPSEVLAAARAVRVTGADHDASAEALMRAALDRWIARRVARAQTGAGGLPSRARRALLARLDAAVRSAGAHDRAALARRIVHVRALVHDAVSAGAEELLADLRQTEFDGLEGLLAACEARLGGTPQHTRPADAARPAVRALLLVRRCP